MRIHPTLVLIVLASALLTGCQTWTRGGAPHTSSKGYTITFPSDWLYHPSFGGQLIATKDGVILQNVVAKRTAISTPLPNSKRTLAATLSPFEVAESLVDDLKSNRELSRFNVRENIPVTFAGKPGFKFTVDYHTSEGLHLAETRYGCLHNGFLYELTLRSPARFYFARDTPAFDQIARSVTLVAK